MTWTIKEVELTPETESSTIAIAIIQHVTEPLSLAVKLIRTRNGNLFCAPPSVRFKNQFTPAYNHIDLQRDELEIIAQQLIQKLEIDNTTDNEPKTEQIPF